MTKLNEKMARVAYAIGRTRDQMETPEQKAIVDYVTAEITRLAFGNKSRNQIMEFARVAKYKKEFKENMKQFLETGDINA